jgi:hypothetical protein
MPLNLAHWPMMTTAEKLNHCADLTTIVPMAGPSPRLVTFQVRCGPFFKGETAGLPAAEALAVVGAGFASFVV